MLIVRDALVYRNNSFLSSIDPKILQRFINPLNEVQKAFSEGREAVKDKLNIDENSLKKEFSELYLLDSANYKDRRSGSTDFFFFMRKLASEIIGNKKGITFNSDTPLSAYPDYDPMFITYLEKTRTPSKISFNGIAGSNPKVFKPKKGETKDSESFKERVREENIYLAKLRGAMSNLSILSESNFVNDKGSVVNSLGFPLGFNFSYPEGKLEDGTDKYTTKFFRLKRYSKNPYKTEWQEPNLEEGRGLVAGFQAEYEPIESDNMGLFSTMAFTPEILEDAYVKMKELANSTVETEESEFDQEKALEIEKGMVKRAEKIMSNLKENFEKAMNVNANEYMKALRKKQESTEGMIGLIEDLEEEENNDCE